MSTLPATTQGTDEQRELALMKAIGLDRLGPAERELALNIAARYELDLLLKHLVIIEGRAYITRDGLLHVAHRSTVFDGIEVGSVVLDGKYYRCVASVWRKDMSHPFTYRGRYPVEGRNKAYAEEMAIKVAEVAALRRAFDVSAPTVEERWEMPDPSPEDEGKPTASLADLAAAKAAAIVEDDPEVQHEPVVEGQEAMFDAAESARIDAEEVEGQA